MQAHEAISSLAGIHDLMSHYIMKISVKAFHFIISVADFIRI